MVLWPVDNTPPHMVWLVARVTVKVLDFQTQKVSYPRNHQISFTVEIEKIQTELQAVLKNN